jgi:hypothetical protein
VVLAYPSVICRLIREEAPCRVPPAPLTAIGIDKTGHSDLLNRIIRFYCFEQELLAPNLINVQTHFGDSAEESTT